MSQTRVSIRWMIRVDMPDVYEITNASFDAPWGEEEFLRVLRQRNCIGMVAELGDKIVGYMVYELKRGSLTVLAMAVHPELRRRGVGRQMVRKLAGKLSEKRRKYLSLCIRETGLGGQLFFRSCGLRAVSVLREHFEDTGEDGYEMRLDAEAEVAEPVSCG